jgi:hypothetical protein
MSIVLDPLEAVHAALAEGGEACVAGSIFLLGDVLAGLTRR